MMESKIFGAESVGLIMFIIMQILVNELLFWVLSVFGLHIPWIHVAVVTGLSWITTISLMILTDKRKIKN